MALPSIVFSPTVFWVPQVILETDFQNPPFDTSNNGGFSDWAANVAGGKVALINATPPWEWTPILDSKDEFDSLLVGLSGDVVITHVSQRDNPFLHPFGFDWTADVNVDSQYQSLVAPGNEKGLEADVKEALDARGLPHTSVMHIETDQGLIPEEYRAQEDDRVAIFGRWIVDCGHDSFGSEIHPPLVMVSARSEGGDHTHSTIIGRPYLVSQEFGDGGLRQHLINEIIRVAPKIPGIPIPFGTHVEAHPNVFLVPFSGIQIIKYFVRPPRRRLSPEEKLIVQFHFTVRTGVALSVFNASTDQEDGVAVLITMNDDNYIKHPLTNRHDWNVSLDDLDKLSPSETGGDGLGTTIKKVLVGVALGDFLDPASALVATSILGQGVLTHFFDAPVASSVHDSEIMAGSADDLPNMPHFSVDDTQPFPIYGFLDLSWNNPNTPSPG